MKLTTIALALAAGLSATPAFAFGPGDCSGAINQQIGTVVQFKNGVGKIYPGFLLSFNAATLKWNVYVISVGTATSVVFDQTQTKNRSFAVISCASPF